MTRPRRRLPRSFLKSTLIHVGLGVAVIIFMILDHVPQPSLVPIEIQLNDVHVHRQEAPREAPPKKKVIQKQKISEEPSKTADAKAEVQPDPQVAWQRLSSGQRNEYLAALIQLISKHRYYPRASILNEEEGVVHVKVSLGADGKLISSEVAQSSGHPRLDEAAITTIANIGVFPLPAPGVPGVPGVVLLVPIRYEMNPDH